MRLIVHGTVLAILALGFLPFGVTAATPAPVVASTPVRAVQTLLMPFYAPAAQHNSCQALIGHDATCPVSARLLYRLQNPLTYRENGNLICRCQNPPRAVHFKQIDGNGYIAHISTQWDYGTSSYSIIFVAAHQNGGWAVDDSYCSGHPATSLYQPPTGPCL